jgi:hypothetical protein
MKKYGTKKHSSQNYQAALEFFQDEKIVRTLEHSNIKSL